MYLFNYFSQLIKLLIKFNRDHAVYLTFKFQKPWTTSQEKRLHILAEAEKSRRKRAEKKLVNMLAYQSFEADSSLSRVC